MNTVIIGGRLCGDPELRHTPDETPVTSFLLAVDLPKRAQTEEKTANFFSVVAWRNVAEYLAENFRKGQRVMVEGRLQSRRYTDKEGIERTAVEVVADHVYYASRPAYETDAE